MKNTITILIATVIVQVLGLVCLTYYVTRYEFALLGKFLLTIFLLDVLFLYKNKYIKLISCFFLVVLALQTTNYLVTGKFITTEAILCIEEYRAIGIETTIKLLLFLSLIILIWLPNIVLSPIKNRNNIIVLFILLLIFITKPVHLFFFNIFEAYKIIHFQPDMACALDFKREKIIIGNSPINCKNYNIILIFAEGTSDCVISPNVTPNLYSLRQKSLYFTNYFNHVQPTYRGVRGSNISGYQLHEIEWVFSMKKYQNKCFAISLPIILSKYDYKTAFVSPHKKSGKFSELCRLIGFKEIDAPETIDDQDDKTTYEHLFSLIDKYEKNNDKFIVSTYLLGTHLGWDSPHKKYGDGKDVFLNKFYNQDYWFGKFIEKLESHSYLDNTLLVFTSDHAAYPAPGFKRAFNSDSNEMFDRIPLIIYKKGMEPQVFDAKNRNSLSLAPTILNLFGIENEENYFLGNSLFSEEVTEYQYISVTVPTKYFYTKDGNVTLKRANKQLKEKLIKYFKAFG